MFVSLANGRQSRLPSVTRRVTLIECAGGFSFSADGLSVPDFRISTLPIEWILCALRYPNCWECQPMSVRRSRSAVAITGSCPPPDEGQVAVRSPLCAGSPARTPAFTTASTTVAAALWSAGLCLGPSRPGRLSSGSDVCRWSAVDTISPRAQASQLWVRAASFSGQLLGTPAKA